MAFIDNPIVNSLGTALGLGSVFDAARGGTDAPLLGAASPAPAEGPPQNTPPAKAGASKPNVPEYRNRPYIPRMETPGGNGGVKPGAGGNMNPVMPGGMDPSTLQDPNVLKMLSQYGVTPSTTPPDPNLFLRNPSAYARHPLLSGLLEHGLEGLAYMHPGANFLQSLGGGVQGLQEANAARAQTVNAQTMAPLQQAQAVAALQEKIDQHQTATDNVAYHQGMLKYYQQSEQDKADKFMNIPPTYDKNTGEFKALRPDDKSSTGYSWQVEPSLGRDEEVYQRNQYVQKGIQDIADKKYGGDETKVSALERLGVISNLESALSEAKATGANTGKKITAGASTTNARIRAGASAANRPGKLTDVQRVRLTEIKSKQAELDKEYNRVDTAGAAYITGLDGKPLVNTKAKENYKSNLRQQRDALDVQANQIMGVSPATPITPSLSSDNPFAQPKK